MSPWQGVTVTGFVHADCPSRRYSWSPPVSYARPSASSRCLNGDPIGERSFPGRDPNKSKDLVFRVGVANDVTDAVRVEGGFSGLSGRGSHKSRSAASDLVSTIDLVPGTFGPEYGRGIGGPVRVETLTLPRSTHGSLAADTLDGSALVSTELGARVRDAGSP